MKHNIYYQTLWAEQKDGLRLPTEAPKRAWMRVYKREGAAPWRVKTLWD